MFVDETSAYVGQSREYGWASSDERVYDSRPKGKKARVSLVAATSLDGAMVEQALVITDTVNQNAFLCFLDTTLLPTLAKGSIVVMDNWTVHRLGRNAQYCGCPHSEEVSGLVERFGCELMYLPTYSPDFVLDKTAPVLALKQHLSGLAAPGPVRNPIEHLFAKVKAFVKSLRPDTADKLVEAFCNAVKSITSENVYNSFRHCGYQAG